MQERRVCKASLALEAQWLRRDIGADVKRRRQALRWSYEEMAYRLRKVYSVHELEWLEDGRMFQKSPQLTLDILYLLGVIEDRRGGLSPYLSLYDRRSNEQSRNKQSSEEAHGEVQQTVYRARQD